MEKNEKWFRNIENKKTPHKPLIDYGRPESSLIHGLTTPAWTGSGWLGLCQSFQDLLRLRICASRSACGDK